RVARLVPEDALEPLRVAALDLLHHRALEALEARVREVKGNRDAGNAIRREPLLADPRVRAEVDAAALEVPIEASHVARKRRALELALQVAEAHPEQLFVTEPRPRRPLCTHALRPGRAASRGGRARDGKRHGNRGLMRRQGTG